MGRMGIEYPLTFFFTDFIDENQPLLGLHTA